MLSRVIRRSQLLASHFASVRSVRFQTSSSGDDMFTDFNMSTDAFAIPTPIEVIEETKPISFDDNILSLIEEQEPLATLPSTFLKSISDWSDLEVVKAAHLRFPEGMSEINRAGWSPLLIAINANAPVSVLEYLVDNGCHVDKKNNNGITPLMKAIQCKNSVEVVKFLLDRGADVNAVDRKGVSVLIHALTSGVTPPVFYCLLERKIDFDQQLPRGGSLLKFALLMKNDPEVIGLLLDCEVDTTEKDSVGRNLIHLCVMENLSPAIIDFLSDFVDVNGVDTFGNTPLHYAITSDNAVELCDMLLSLDADPNVVNRDKQTPLHKLILSNSNNTDVYTCLLSMGADPNIVYKHGYTSLHLALKNSIYVDNVISLMDSGANRSAITDDRTTPLLLARDNYEGNERVLLVNILSMSEEEYERSKIVDENGELLMVNDS